MSFYQFLKKLQENLWKHIDFNKNNNLPIGTKIVIIDQNHPMFKHGETTGGIIGINHKNQTYSVELYPFWAKEAVIELHPNQFVTEKDWDSFDPEMGSHLDDKE